MDKTARERMRRYRERQRNGSVTNEEVNVTESVTEKARSVTPSVTAYHPILYALTDPVKRKKLEAICLALKRRGLGGMVYYGMLQPIDFLTVGDLLEATQ